MDVPGRIVRDKKLRLIKESALRTACALSEWWRQFCRQTCTDRQTDMQAGRQTGRQASRQTDKHNDRQPHSLTSPKTDKLVNQLSWFTYFGIQIDTDKQTNRQTDTHTGRQADRQTNRRTDRQTNQQTDTHSNRERERQTKKPVKPNAAPVVSMLSDQTHI